MKNLLIGILLLPLLAVGQITDTWDDVYVNGTSFNKMYVNGALVWQKVSETFEYLDNGGLAYNDATPYIDVPFPTTVNSGDLLILILHIKQNDMYGTIAGQDGFTLISYRDNNDGTVVAWFYKIAAGSESGTVQINHNFYPTNGQAAVMFRYTSPASVDVSNTYTDYYSNSNGQGSGIVSLSSGQASIIFISCETDYTVTISGGSNTYTLDAVLYTSSGGGFAIGAASSDVVETTQSTNWGWATFQTNVGYEGLILNY
jgi:hypothetical protein